jgi:hypothetical protein
MDSDLEKAQFFLSRFDKIKDPWTISRVLTLNIPKNRATKVSRTFKYSRPRVLNCLGFFFFSNKKRLIGLSVSSWENTFFGSFAFLPKKLQKEKYTHLEKKVCLFHLGAPIKNQNKNQRFCLDL